MDEGDRSEWPGWRIEENIGPLRPLPNVVAKHDVRLDKLEERDGKIDEEMRRVEDDLHSGDRRLHERVDGEVKERTDGDKAVDTKVGNVRAELLTALSDRDREYRRNLIIAVGPLLVVALLIAAKVLFGIDLPKL